MSDAVTEVTLRKIFLDIARGYCSATYKEQTIFIKHFNIFDQEQLDLAHEARVAKLKGHGIGSEQDKLEELKKAGTWTEGNEKKLRDAETFAANLIKTKRALIIPSQIAQMDEKVKKAQEDAEKLRQERHNLLSDTAEGFASRYISDLSIFRSFFKTDDLKTPFFTEGEFEELERQEIYILIKLYNDAFNDISLHHIKYLALSGLFMNYFNLNENAAHEIFECAPLALSFYQLNLLTYCKIFKSIFKNIPEIPEDMRDDPDKLLEFADSGANAQQKIEAMKRRAGKGGKPRAMSVVGATADDMQQMGYDQTDMMSPGEFLKKKGKTSYSLVQDGDFNV